MRPRRSFRRHFVAPLRAYLETVLLALGIVLCLLLTAYVWIQLDRVDQAAANSAPATQVTGSR